MGRYDWSGYGSDSRVPHPERSVGLLKPARSLRALGMKQVGGRRRAAEGACPSASSGTAGRVSEWKIRQVRRPLATVSYLQFESVTSSHR